MVLTSSRAFSTQENRSESLKTRQPNRENFALSSGAGKAAEGVSKLLFILASTDRLSLLSEISVRKQRLTDLSKTIGASAQECSRHLARLSSEGLIVKGSDSLYETTALGKAMQRILPSVEFLLRNRDTFISHDLSFLPASFVERIGDLSSGKYVNHLSQVLEHIKATISGARDHVWLISDQPIVVGEIGASFYSRDIPVRLISEPTVDPKLLREIRKALPRSEFGAVQDVKVAMAMNEKFAGVCFPGLDAEIDFSAGFAGGGDQFRAWCEDLFEYYWSKSRKVALF